ncbi:hypothetical protein HAP47_0005470 [Bradyrhizobium sp. 41S5]|uniref:hypothetical protein n=1 Tax=Bradyrhizobium sp. 41S5 TaxID=1404443 RepID=UPI001E2EBE01|nr:hypothetical protein [Bradyrhizobium sp. 41S5]UFX49317.1 hypothetical protein HAP47_0005470 [Bradyrhizobium sp. 41S5]
MPRPLALLGWANTADAYVIEDDYDSEFRFVGRPLPALKSLDREQRVIYAGSFSKTLFPGLRLGYRCCPTGCSEISLTPAPRGPRDTACSSNAWSRPSWPRDSSRGT